MRTFASKSNLVYICISGSTFLLSDTRDFSTNDTSEIIRAANFYRYIVALPLMAVLFGIKATDRVKSFYAQTFNIFYM